jgi:hypothetical protein
MQFKNIKYEESINNIIKEFNELLNNIALHEINKNLTMAALCEELTDIQMRYDQIPKHNIEKEKRELKKVNNDFYLFLNGDIWLKTYANKLLKKIISFKKNQKLILNH